MIIGAVFCFILSFGDFVSPYYLGGSRPPTLSILIIDTTKSGQQWPKAAVVAITMVVTLIVVAFVAVGALLDRWLNASPVFTVIGVFLGGGAGFYSLVRRVFAIQKGDSPRKQENDGSSEPKGKAPDNL